MQGLSAFDFLPDAAAAPEELPHLHEQAANQLEALRSMSKVVADTGDLAEIERYRPVDATTNPTLLLRAVAMPQYGHFLDEALAAEGGTVAHPDAVADRLAVTVGAQILQLVPGRVSTEVDARLSFNTQATVDKALRIIDLYGKLGHDPSRVYIKIASTWEGIRACETLQKQGIECNMTLLFSFAQACACAGATLISPFVGRILDWYKKAKGRDYTPSEDPGVLSVKRIYAYYKQYGYRTTVMAASFRNVGEIRELAGCDAITISPALLAELEASTDPLPHALWPAMGGCSDPLFSMRGSKAHGVFEQMHGSDAMAVDKLREGVNGFAADQKKLVAMIVERAGK